MFFSNNENDYECLLCFSGFFCFFLIWNWCLVWLFCQIGLASHWSFTTYRFIFFFDWFFPRCFYRSKWKMQSFAKNCSLNVPWQKREAMKAFVTSQPGKCLLLWMFCNSSLESLKINSFCDKVLRIV